MLQQQHAQLTIKRAASGIMDGMLPGGKRHSGGSTNSPLHPSNDAAGAGPAAAGSADGQVPEGSGLSSSGLRRAMLSIKSVTATPLSAAAKASIINTIADNALASFVVIQVGHCGTAYIAAPLQAVAVTTTQHRHAPLISLKILCTHHLQLQACTLLVKSMHCCLQGSMSRTGCMSCSLCVLIWHS